MVRPKCGAERKGPKRITTSIRGTEFCITGLEEHPDGFPEEIGDARPPFFSWVVTAQLAHHWCAAYQWCVAHLCWAMMAEAFRLPSQSSEKSI
jgi:hypothetical protein